MPVSSRQCQQKGGHALDAVHIQHQLPDLDGVDEAGHFFYLSAASAFEACMTWSCLQESGDTWGIEAEQKMGIMAKDDFDNMIKKSDTAAPSKDALHDAPISPQAVSDSQQKIL